MSESLDSASRPATERKRSKVKPETDDERKARVTLMAQRFENLRDIYSGKPLEGRDRREADRVNKGLED